MITLEQSIHRLCLLGVWEDCKERRGKGDVVNKQRPHHRLGKDGNWCLHSTVFIPKGESARYSWGCAPECCQLPRHQLSAGSCASGWAQAHMNSPRGHLCWNGFCAGLLLLSINNQKRRKKTTSSVYQNALSMGVMSVQLCVQVHEHIKCQYLGTSEVGEDFNYMT